MRDFKGMKRQRGRNRGGGGGSGGGNQKPTQNANRAFDSNGPDNVKVRGNAQHVFEKYQQLARDASSGGDRVLAENYLQHAEHYFRLIRALQPTRPASEIIGRDQFASGYDIDFEDEALQAQAEAADEAALEAGPIEARHENGDQSQTRDRPRDERPREDRQRDDRPRGEWQGRENRDRDQNRNRDERPRDDRPRDDRPRGEWQNRDGNRDRNRDRPRDERPRDDRPQGERPQGEERRERYDRGDRPERADRDPAPAVQLAAEPVVEERGHMLRDADGGESHAPAFLQAARPAPAPVDAEDKPVRPRRRRAPRSFEPGEGGPAAETEDA